MIYIIDAAGFDCLCSGAGTPVGDRVYFTSDLVSFGYTRCVGPPALNGTPQ